MSQSPLQRSTRRSLPAFAHTPSRLSKATSSTDLAGTARRKSRFVQPDLPEDSAASSSHVDNSTSTETPTSRSYSTPVRQSSYDDSPTPRHTPIYYSPQATSTPPAGLSKSASIPFDMAASAKAARRATAERRDSGQLPAGTAESKGQGKKRYIRKKSIFQRISDYLQHLIDTFLLLSPTSMLDLLPDERYAHPIAVGMHTVHFLVTAPLWTRKDDETSILRSTTDRRGVGGRWGKWEEEQRGKGFAGGWGVFIFTVLLLLLASANAIYLFSRFRTYDMQLRSAQEPLVSPHASPVKSPLAPSADPFAMPSDTDDNIKPEETMGKKVARMAWRIVVFLVKGTYAAILSMLGRPSETPLAGYTAEDRIQALKVWDPPDFCLAFFCAYPPTSPLQTHLLTPLHPLLTPLLHLTSALLLSYLSQHFRQLVKDRMVLSAEVMREYDRRFVYKRVFASRVDRSVQTEQAETVW